MIQDSKIFTLDFILQRSLQESLRNNVISQAFKFILTPLT